jgi:hypothetical protein
VRRSRPRDEAVEEDPQHAHDQQGGRAVAPKQAALRDVSPDPSRRRGERAPVLGDACVRQGRRCRQVTGRASALIAVALVEASAQAILRLAAGLGGVRMLHSEASVTRVREREVTAAIGGQPQEGAGASVRSVELGIGHPGDHSHVVPGRLPPSGHVPVGAARIALGAPRRRPSSADWLGIRLPPARRRLRHSDRCPRNRPLYDSDPHGA